MTDPRPRTALRLKILFGASCLFIASGAFNYGWSRFALAVPFMVAALVIAGKAFSRRAFALTLLGCVVAIGVNLTLERNPLVFPILDGGMVTIEKDGFQHIFPDGSGSFTGKPGTGDYDQGDVPYRPLHKGDRFPVTGIIATHPDMGTRLVIRTEAGQFANPAPYTTDGFAQGAITLNKPAETLFAYAGGLMYYPILPLMLFGQK